jgi:predicted acyltransferase
MSNLNDTSGSQVRFLSLDVLRGLDMFFLVGFAGIFKALPELSDNEVFSWLANQCEHPEWQGFTAWDLIFPMFIFIVGVAMPFSFSKRLKSDGGKKELFKHVLTRAIVLSVLGVILWQKPGGAHPYYGYYSVLYRIGFSYFFAAIIMMNTNIRGQIYWAFGLLIGHWLALRFIPVPGYGIGNFSQDGNVGAVISTAVANYISPNFKYVFSVNLIPSISNALFGVLAGHWLISENSGNRKVKGLLIAGLLFIIIGLIVHLDFPINKKLSTPSFTLLTCGISAFLLSVFFWIIDIKGYKKWTFFFVVVGANSIAIYVCNSLLNFNSVANVFMGGFDFGKAQALMIAITVAVVKWLFLYYLYRQKIYFKI